MRTPPQVLPLPDVDAPPALEDVLLPRPWRVLEVRRCTSDVVSIESEPADGGPVLVHQPGQFDMLSLPGLGEVAISISSDPDTEVRTHTIRAVGTVSRALSALVPGDIFGLRGPYGRPWPMTVAQGRDLLIVGGGLGVAPVRSAITRALANRNRYGRIEVVAGARTPDDLLFAEDLLRWDDDHDIEVRMIVDRGSQEWDGPVGVVTRLLPSTRVDRDAVAFVCGPEVMMRFVGRSLLALGLDPADIFISLERTMRCGVGTCGHCQFGPVLLCTQGPVVDMVTAARLLEVRAL